MELALLVYGISVMSSAGGFLAAIMGGFSVYLTIQLIRMIDSKHNRSSRYLTKGKDWHDQHEKKLFTSMKKIITGMCITGLVGVLLPTEKTMWMMTAAYAGQSAVQSETARKLGVLIEKKLEGLIEGIDEEAKKKIKQNSTKESK